MANSAEHREAASPVSLDDLTRVRAANEDRNEAPIVAVPNVDQIAAFARIRNPTSEISVVARDLRLMAVPVGPAVPVGLAHVRDNSVRHKVPVNKD